MGKRSTWAAMRIATAILDLAQIHEHCQFETAMRSLWKTRRFRQRYCPLLLRVPLQAERGQCRPTAHTSKTPLNIVVGTLHPIVTQYEEEQTYKLLTDKRVEKGLEIRINMMASSRATSSRATWYRAMSELSCLHRMTSPRWKIFRMSLAAAGRRASLNYVPLDLVAGTEQAKTRRHGRRKRSNPWK